MKTLRWIAVSLAVLAAVVAPAAPVLKDAWAVTDDLMMPNNVVRRIAMLPWAIAGLADARRDIDANRLQVLTAGYPASWRPAYAELLWTRHHIRLVTAGGCVIEPKKEARWSGYNLLMVREIERRYGKDVLASVAEEVQRQEQATVARAGRP